MFACGLKRKCSEEEEEAPADPLQRQSLLDKSLVKLQLCHMLAEPNLCRSVLIADTLRQIQEEAGVHGDSVPLGSGGAAPAPDPADLASAVHAVPWQHRLPELCQEAPGTGPAPERAAGGFPRSLDQVFETLENHGPGAVEELFSDVDASSYDPDAVLTGMVGGAKSGPEGLESFASAAAPPPGAGCKADLGELDRVVEILVET